MPTNQKKAKPAPKLTVLYNIEAEQSLLGCILMELSPESLVVDRIVSKVTADDFTGIHKILFTTMSAIHRKGVSVDYVTLTEGLERIGKLDEVGGLNYILKLTEKVPSTANYESYLTIVKDYAKLRKYQRVGTYIADLVVEGKNSDAVRHEIEGYIEKVFNEDLDTETVEHAKEPTKIEVERINKIREGQYDDFGLGTGFPVLDKTLWGLQPSDLVTVGARAGVGKTAFALNLIKQAALRNKKNCLFFSLEMPKNQIIKRLLSLCAGIDNIEIKKAKGLTDAQMREIASVEELIAGGGLYIDDTSNNTVQGMSLKAKWLKRKQGLDLIVVDYLQFVKPAHKTKDRFQDVGEIARDLKVMARQLNVPVVALCQLSRALDNESREPTLADIRESGEIENNSDIVMFLHPVDSKFSEIRKIDLIIGKFRNGQMKAIKMQYEGKYFRFKELDEVPKSKPVQAKIELEPIDDDSLPF